MIDIFWGIDSGPWAEWFGAVATFLAVFVALFQDRLKAAVFHPDLKINFDMDYCNKGSIKDTHYYFFRLWIENVGDVRAEKVEVFLSSVYREGDRELIKIPLLPMNLRWTHWNSELRSSSVFADGISPGMGMHCELATIADPKLGDEVPLKLEVEVQTGQYILKEGTYVLELDVAAGNRKPTRRKVKISYQGRWYENEEEMFSKGIKIDLIEPVDDCDSFA